MSRVKFKTDKVVKLQGKEYILFEGLLECAHQEYEIQKVDTKLLQIPNKENDETCVVQATVVTKDGKVFTAHGDANPLNVNSKIVPHLIRMAETRAVGRALRFLTGYGTVFEELGDLDEIENSASEKNVIVHPATPSSKIRVGKVESLATKAQLNKIEKDSQSIGISSKEACKKLGYNLEELTKSQASEVIKWLKQPKDVSIDEENLPF